MTLGSHLRSLHTCLDAIEAELLNMYGEAFNLPNNSNGITRLETMDSLLERLSSEGFATRLRIQELLEVRRATATQ